LMVPIEQTIVAPNRTSELVHGGAEHRLMVEGHRGGDRQSRRPVENLWRRMGWDELEVRIALMLQARSSNAEIAQRLEISEEAAAHRTARILAALCARIRKHGDRTRRWCRAEGISCGSLPEDREVICRKS